MNRMRCPLFILAILLLISAFQSSTMRATAPQNFPLSALADPLGHFEGNGSPAQITWTGDGQVISNPSFETGVLTPWVATSYNAGNRSSVQVSSPGYDGGAKSVHITLFSANLTIGSNSNLEYDVSQSQVGFNTALRFRAAVFVENMTGATALDRVEVAVTLFTSTGATRTIHYIFDGPTVSMKTVIYNKNGNGIYIRGSDLIVSGNAPVNGTLLSVDPRVKFVDTPPATSPDATGTWSPPETVAYDADATGTFSSGDLVIAGTTPAMGTNLSMDSKLKFVDAPPASTPNSPGTVVIGNTASDIYVQVQGSGLTGQWLTIDRNVAVDASAFADSSIIDSVRRVRLSSMAQSFANPDHDPHVKYVDATNQNVWILGDTLVYDANMNSVYDSGIDTVLVGTTPVSGTSLKHDSLIRYVDTDRDGIWNTGEPIVYDANNNGLYTFGEPSLYQTAPPYGTPLVTRVIETTSALFDQVELYAASGNTNWIYNGGFETGLTGWYSPGFAPSNAQVLAGSSSARGMVTNGMGEMAQSIDALPRVETSTVFTASAYVGKMDGSSAGDFVDVWLGLLDSQGNASSVYYYFRTGDGSLPLNRTDATYHKAPGFGTTNPQWFSLSVPLYLEEARFNTLGFVPPYRVEVVVAEVAAAGSSSTTTVYFDQFSILRPGYSGSATSYFYANNGVNSTYAYSASGIPQGSLSFQVPSSEQVLNITAPDGATILVGTYSTLPSCCPTFTTVTVQPAAFFGHPPVGTWTLYTSSTNAAAGLYAQDPITQSPLTAVQAGSTVNIASQSKDPLGRPLSAASATITLWNPSGSLVATWAGSTNGQGWWNTTGVILPPAGSPAGTYTLQATVSSTAGYVGVRTVQLPVRNILTLSLTVSSASISQGTPVTISGFAIGQSTGTPLQGVNVTLSYREAGSSTWIPFATVPTDSAGKYSYNWTPPQGVYDVMSSVGDSTTQTAQSPQSQITVNPSTNQPLISFLPWLLIGVAVAAAAFTTVFFLFRKKRTPTNSPSGPVSNPKKGTSNGKTSKLRIAQNQP